MSEQKKNGDENKALPYIVFITATLNLIEVIIEIIKHLTE